jgi:UrcA family protein
VPVPDFYSRKSLVGTFPSRIEALFCKGDPSPMTGAGRDKIKDCRRNRMIRKMLVALAATMVCALPTAALALDNSLDVIVERTNRAEKYSTVVSLAGLDLASDQGVRWADGRIVKASRQVCGWVQGTVLPETREYRTCVGDALNNARNDLDKIIAARRQG